MKLKKLFRYIGYTLLAVFVLINVSAAFHAWRLTHFYDIEGPFKKPHQLNNTGKLKALLLGVKIPKPIVTTPLPLPYDTLQLKTAEGLLIDCWYAKKQKAKGTVALFHGHLATKGAVVDEAVAFYRLGYSVLLVDFRGHGNSAGNYCTVGYKEGEEVKLSIDYLQTKGEKKIIVWGISMGAAAITSAFKNYNIQPSAAILELPFGSLHAAVCSRIKVMGLPQEPLASLLTFWGGTENGFNAFKFSPAEYAKNIHCPTLVQAGKLDPRVSMAEIDELYAHLGTPQKQKVVYSTAYHQSLLGRDNEKWRNVVSVFLSNIK